MAIRSRQASEMSQEIREQTNLLVAQLADPRGLVRLTARRSLVDMGAVGVPALVEALQSHDRRLRWEAAKALSEVCDPSAITPLLDAMLDDDPEIRWLAADGIAAIGWPAVRPLLRALIAESDRTLFRLGAHHVLRTLEGRRADNVLRPVLRALESMEPSVEVPIAAEEVLYQLTLEDSAWAA